MPVMVLSRIIGDGAASLRVIVVSRRAVIRHVTVLGHGRHRLFPAGRAGLMILRVTVTVPGAGHGTRSIGPSRVLSLRSKRVHPVWCTVDLSHTNLGLEGTKKLAAIFSTNSNIRKLTLQWNNINVGGAVHLAQALENCPLLECLDLLWNQLGDEGTALVAEGLRNCPSMKRLNMSYNAIGDCGATQLAPVLRKCSNTVRTLSNSDTAELVTLT
eukprot:1212211-Rhodomonas_salina.2